MVYLQTPVFHPLYIVVGNYNISDTLDILWKINIELPELQIFINRKSDKLTVKEFQCAFPEIKS